MSSFVVQGMPEAIHDAFEFLAKIDFYRNLCEAVEVCLHILIGTERSAFPIFNWVVVQAVALAISETGQAPNEDKKYVRGYWTL